MFAVTRERNGYDSVLEGAMGVCTPEWRKGGKVWTRWFGEEEEEREEEEGEEEAGTFSFLYCKGNRWLKHLGCSSLKRGKRERYLQHRAQCPTAEILINRRRWSTFHKHGQRETFLL